MLHTWGSDTILLRFYFHLEENNLPFHIWKEVLTSGFEEVVSYLAVVLLDGQISYTYAFILKVLIR